MCYKTAKISETTLELSCKTERRRLKSESILPVSYSATEKRVNGPRFSVKNDIVRIGAGAMGGFRVHSPRPSRKCNRRAFGNAKCSEYADVNLRDHRLARLWSALGVLGLPCSLCGIADPCRAGCGGTRQSADFSGIASLSHLSFLTTRSSRPTCLFPGQSDFRPISSMPVPVFPGQREFATMPRSSMLAAISATRW